MVNYTHADAQASFSNLYRKFVSSSSVFLVYLALLKFLLQIIPGESYGYGFFRDELYYIDAGKHLAFGYVEFPPFIALLAASVHTIFGDSLLAYRIFPALAGAFMVLLTGLIARELGAGRFAQCLAALACLVAPTFLGIDSLFSMDSFDELWWVFLAYLLTRLIKRNQPRIWLLFGLVAGIGLLTKITMLMFGFAIVSGLLLTPQRKYLLNKWVWLGGAIALALLLPYILWNATNAWPTLEFWSGYANGHANPASVLEFFKQQIVTMNPATFPLWLLGLYYYFFTQEGKPYRVFGWTFIILYLLFTLSHAKLYFLAPVYPMLFAAGSLLIEEWLLCKPRFNWLKPTYISLLVIIGLLLAPIAMPLLPPVIAGQMASFVGASVNIKIENRETGLLPQQLADRFGWEAMVATIAQVYHSLPQDEQSHACIFAANYGEAGAVNLYRSQYHLPQAISTHNTYYLWGPGSCTGQVLLSIGYPLDTLQSAFRSVALASTITCVYCMPQENDLPIYVCRHLLLPMQTLWHRVKHYD